ncbi:putative sulfurtransferase DndC [Burkholderia pseudomallei]|nr:putative sulfurtransferase DndC [Burkholderia pseudomallei]CFD91155.1 putative sulfurtransferase DndC [Burkholderia pseudomallei]CPF19039.1 putative sulfurtransferase DndC [Burkholderia pseudomallei]CPF58211.1 putative sulfurtransferase DndC [Burkholderia pseudomallei]
MQAMIQNDEQKQWMQPILDFRNKNLVLDDRHDRDFRRLNGRLTVFRDELVHGPYTQARRASLLKELLLTQKRVRAADVPRGTQLIELVSVEELDEIRRIWVEEKGELEDLVPKIYSEVFEVPYPGRDLEQAPLDRDDLGLLEHVAAEIEVETEAAQELYKLTRSLLAVQFQSIESNKRSKHLDRLEGVLRHYAFRNEQEALEFALSSREEDEDGSDAAALIV